MVLLPAAEQIAKLGQEEVGEGKMERKSKALLRLHLMQFTYAP